MKNKSFPIGRLVLPSLAVGLALILMVLFFRLSRRARALRLEVQRIGAEIGAIPHARFISNGAYCDALERNLTKNRDLWASLFRRQRAAVPFLVSLDRCAQKSDLHCQILAATKFLRDLAEQKNVPLLEGERFGFLKDLARTSAVQVRRCLMEEQCIVAILYLLFSAGDNDLKFLHIRREATDGEDGKNAVDFFRPEELSTPYGRHRRDSLVFNLRFHAFTGTFQRFLNVIVENRFPILLRAISVETPIVDPHANPAGEWLVIDPQLSDFNLVLEWVSPEHFCDGRPVRTE